MNTLQILNNFPGNTVYGKNDFFSWEPVVQKISELLEQIQSPPLSSCVNKAIILGIEHFFTCTLEKSRKNSKTEITELIEVIHLVFIRISALTEYISNRAPNDYPGLKEKVREAFSFVDLLRKSETFKQLQYLTELRFTLDAIISQMPLKYYKEFKLYQKLLAITVSMFEITPNFLVQEKIREEAFSQIFNITFGKQKYALKVFPDSNVNVNDIIKQQHKNKMLEHLNIVFPLYFFRKLHLAEQEIDVCAYVMETFSHTLEECLPLQKKQWKVSHSVFEERNFAREILRFLADIAASLYSLHRQKQAHKAIKLNNILINQNKAVLDNFGIVDEPSKKIYTQKDDLYNWGIVLCHALFFVDNPEQLSEGPSLPFPLNQAKETAQKLIRGLCHKDPNKRVPMRDARDGLEVLFSATKNNPKEAQRMLNDICNIITKITEK